MVDTINSHHGGRSQITALMKAENDYNEWRLATTLGIPDGSMKLFLGTFQTGTLVKASAEKSPIKQPTSKKVRIDRRKLHGEVMKPVKCYVTLNNHRLLCEGIFSQITLVSTFSLTWRSGRRLYVRVLHSIN